MGSRPPRRGRAATAARRSRRHRRHRKGRVLDLQKGQVAVVGDPHHPGDELVGVRDLLHLQKGRVGDHVGTGEHAPGPDNNARPGAARRRARLPGRVVVRLLGGGVDANDRWIRHLTEMQSAVAAGPSTRGAAVPHAGHGRSSSSATSTPTTPGAAPSASTSDIQSRCMTSATRRTSSSRASKSALGEQLPDAQPPSGAPRVTGTVVVEQLFNQPLELAYRSLSHGHERCSGQYFLRVAVVHQAEHCSSTAPPWRRARWLEPPEITRPRSFGTDAYLRPRKNGSTWRRPQVRSWAGPRRRSHRPRPQRPRSRRPPA